LQQSAEVYTSQTGNQVNVVLQARPTYPDKLQIALVGGSQEPDAALIISRDMVPYAAGGFIAPLDGYIANTPDYNLNDISQALWPNQQWKGTWYMAPTDLSIETLVYRTDLIPTPPATWDDLLTMAEQFTQSINPNSPTQYGWAYSAGPTITEASWMGLLKSYGGAILDDRGNVVVDSQAAIDSWTFHVDLMRKHKVTPPDLQAWDYPEILVALQEGVLPMASFFNAGMPVLADCDQTPKFCGKFALVPQPAGPKGSFTRTQTLGLVMNAASNAKDATWSFIGWVTGQAGGLTYTKFGGASPRASVAADPDISSTRPWTAGMLTAANSPALAFQHERSKELLDILHKWQSRALSGDITPEESLRQAAQEMRALLNG
jgi:multiple sugar transport system substrate-binding protein